MTKRSEPQERDETNGCPSYRRPDVQPPAGWSHALATSIERPRSHSPSPEGTQIAFFWDRNDLSDLYILPVQGGWPKRLSTDRTPLPYWFDDPPQWSADGQWIAYTDQSQVWIVPVSGGMPRQVAGMLRGLGTPRWMQDSQHLLVTFVEGENTRIVLVDRDGGWPRPVSPVSGRDSCPQAAPDGSRIVYLHQPVDDLNCTDLMLADLSSGDIHPLTHTPDRLNRSPRWSPDGKQIAFTSDRTGFFEIYLVDPLTGTERQLTQTGHDLDDLCWSPDSRRLVCTINREGEFDLTLVEVNTGMLEELRATCGFYARPHWLADGRTVTFEYDDPQHPPDLFKMDLETSQVAQLTFSTPPALSALQFISPEKIRYMSFDGLEIPAFLYRPAKPNGAGIVTPHGGPTAQYTLEWDLWVQYMAAKGYTILAPNFRGSTGYGIEFQRLNYGVWGIDDTKDCLAACDYLAALDGVDAKRAAIFGGSYGGYMAICCLAFDPQHRYACTVAKYGDCNLLTSWALCDRSGRDDLSRILGHPSINRAGYRAGSPVWQVENIQAPLLILHGLHDPYVPPEQSEELVEALKRAGKTYEYRTYADEGHGILQRKNQLDFYERMERFLDWYLL